MLAAVTRTVGNRTVAAAEMTQASVGAGRKTQFRLDDSVRGGRNIELRRDFPDNFCIFAFVVIAGAFSLIQFRCAHMES